MAMDQNSAKLYQQISTYLMNTLTNAVAASDLMASRIERVTDAENRESLAQYLCVLRHSQFQILRLVENMRDLSLLEQGDFALEKQTVDLNRLCAELVEGVNALIPDITIRYRAPDTDCITYCDPTRIERLLLNLLSNSLLHCDPGCEIRIQLQRSDDTLQIIVADNGRGVPRETMGTLFSDYLRAPDYADAARGAGLGLSVAEQIAKAHSGSLIVTSEEGHGTKAVFSLPHIRMPELRSPRPRYQSRLNPILISLSDVLDYTKFQPPFL